MRRIGILVVMGLALAAAPAAATGIGIGVFGGGSLPVANDLSDKGNQYGVRVPVSFAPGLSAEGFFSKSGLGDVTEDFGGVSYTRDGGDLTGLGANVLFSMGAPTLSFRTILGLGTYKLVREGSEDIKKVGYQFGLGMGISPVGLKGVTFDVRGEFLMIPTGDTSQKFAHANVGVSYTFFTTP